MPSRVRRIIFTAAALGVLAGCGSSSGSDGAADTTTGAATSTTVAAEATTSTTASSDTTAVSTTTVTVTAPASTVSEPPQGTDTLPAGDTYAYLKSTSGPSLTFDVVQFLTGQAAVDAAVKAGQASDCDGTPCVDDDYFLVNANPKLRTMQVAQDAKVTITGCDGGCPDPVGASLFEAVNVSGGLFKLTVTGTGAAARITGVQQVFLP